jgi:hypothetical protein
MTVSPLSIRKHRDAWTPALACAALALLVSPAAAEPSAALPAQASSILAQASSGPLHCEIHRTGKGNMIELTGIAGGTRPIAGASTFVVTKSGSSGSSNMNQGQHFSIEVDEPTVVGRATINLDPGGHIAVDLKLQSDDGIECHAQASLER